MIKAEETHIALIGLGYVGLPLALLCSESGFQVTGIDSDEGKIERLKSGRSYTNNVSDQRLGFALEQEKFRPCSEYFDACSADVIVLCVPTPLTSDGEPDYSHIFNAVEQLLQYSLSEKLIILESTVNPQFTRQTLLPFLQQTGLEVGGDFFLGFSPERVDPASPQMTLRNITKIVSGVTEKCLTLTEAFYRRLGVKTKSVSSPEVAEAAKILENTHRDVNIALVNEMAQIFSEAGIDIREVIEAAGTKEYGFTPFYPGHGVGGHCIPVDSVFYTQWARKQGDPACLAESARNINESMPEFAERKLLDVLTEYNLNGPQRKRVFFLGVTYKEDVNDLRGSPTVKLINRLIERYNFEITFHDPFVNVIRADGVNIRGQKLCAETLQQKDCVVFAVAHSLYDREWLKDNSSLIIDMTGKISREDAEHVRDIFN